MSIKTRDNLGKIVLVLLIITAILTATLINLSGLVKGQAGYAEEGADTAAGENTVAATTLVVTDSGKVSYQIPSKSEAENAGYVWVTTYNDLKNAINANLSICLGADISYDANPTNSSGNFAPNAFTGELNGNGHTITINAKESSGSVSKPAASPVEVVNDGYRTTNYYAYSYFIPYNKGTIKNTNFVYTSDHNLIAASALEPGTGDYHFKADSNTYKGPSAGGIITGINDGTISNVSLDVRGQFAFGHNPSQASNSASILISTVIAGGVAGATLGNSVIEYSSVNIGANANGTIVGKHTVIYGNGQGRALAVAGGFVGNIAQYKSGGVSAKFTNNVLTGTGDVVAYTSGRQYATHLFAGGYIASSFVLTGSQNYRTINLTTIENDTVNKQKNPIRGLISSWTGAAISRGIATDAANVSRKAGLFDYVGDASVNIILAYDHATITDEAYIDNSRNAGWYDKDPIDGSTVSHIESWSEAFSTTASGKVYLAYEKTEEGKYTDYVKMGALADDADKNVPEIGQYLSEKGNRYIDMPLTADGHVINSNIQQAKMVYFAKVTANNTTTYDCHPGNFYGGLVKRIGQTWLNDIEYSIQFGEMLDYQVIDNSGNQITVGSEEYSGKPISSMPQVKFLSAYNSSVAGEVAKSWRIMRTPYYMGSEVPAAKVVTALQNTYLTGEYSFYPMESAQFDNNDATYYFAYINTEKLLVSRLNTNNNYKHSINPVGINAQLRENGNWAKQATFDISLTTNSDFNAYRVYRGNGAGDIIKTNGTVTSTQFIDTTTTGSNGAMYRFAVYMVMDDGEEVVLGQTQRGQTGITAKIDNEKPVFRETNIYAYDDTKQYKLGELLDKNDWYNRKIVVEYVVDDDDRSGIANYAIPSTLQYATEVTDGNISRIFIYVDQTEEAITVRIADALGYETTNTQGFNIDTVNLNIKDVQTTAISGEYDQNKKQIIRITIDQKLGSSGWKGYYQSATPGVALNDNSWIETDISALNNGQRLNFDINFSLENKLIYFKFVNNENLFDDVISAGIGPDPSKEDIGWTITLNYGTLNFKRNQVYINGEALTSFSDDEIYNVLKKSYDGSTQCNTTLFDFADTRDGGEVEFIENALEDKSYLNKSNFELIAEYGQSNAGKTTVKLLIRGINQFKELFYVTIEGYEYITLNTEIDKLTVNYDITQDSMTVKYGDTVSMTKEITAIVGEDEYSFTLKYSTDREITDIGTYEYRVEVDNYDNFTINVSGGDYATITVEPKERMIYTLLDGVRNHGATMAFDQKEHSLKAYYLDLDGKVVECESSITAAPTGANNVLRIVGQYTFEFSIADKNYTISSDSSNSTSVFTILSATMPITTGVQEVQYDSLAQVFKPNVPDYALGNLEITYYPVSDVEVDDAGNIKGNVGQRIDPSKVTETGYYKVAVTYTLHDSEKINYHECEIPDGWLVIKKAPVEFQVQEKRVTYTGEKFTMELSEGSGSNIYYFARLFVITANGEKIPYAHLNSSAINDIKITSKVKGVGIGAEDTWEEGVYYNKAGEYEYKVSFKGTSNYTSAEATVKLVIAPATFVGITFNSQSFDYEANIERSISVNIPDIYTQAKVSYSAQGTIGSSNTPIKRTNAGDYTITATVSMENYHNFVINAKMTIKKAKFTNIYAESKEVTFDGNTHEVILVGVEKYKNQGVPVIVTARDGTSALRAGTYMGAYLISATNYETLTIETSLIIKPKEVEVSYQSIIDRNIDSATDISDLTVSYTDPISGEVKSATIEIYDAEGNVVDTTVTKKLKAGEYTAKIKMPDSDFIANNQSSSITFTVEKASNLLPILVIGGVAVVVIGLVVIIIVVASKKKGGKRRV